jgi:hypothetical protein
LLYKRPAEAGWGAFSFAFGFWFGGLFGLGFFWGFGLILLLWAFWCEKLLEGKRISEGKRMAEEGLIESLH